MTINIDQRTLDRTVSEAVSDALHFQDWEREPLGSREQQYYKKLYIRLRDHCGYDGYAMLSHAATTKEDCLQMWLSTLNEFWTHSLVSKNELDWDVARDGGVERLRSRWCMTDGIQATTDRSFDQAEALFRQAAADPDLREARQFLGYVRLELGKYREAQDAFERQLELGGFDLPPRLGIGLAKLYAGDAKGAKAWVAKSMSHDRDGYVVAVLEREVDWYRRQMPSVLEFRSSRNCEYWKAQLYSRLILV